MTGKSAIAERLRATLAKELRQDVKAITAQHTLRDDLGLNSLDAIELMFKIEEEFDLSIPDEDMQRLVTVGDVISYLETKTQGGASKTSAPPQAMRTTVPKSSASPAPGKSVRQARVPAASKSAPARSKAPKSPRVNQSAKRNKTKGSRRHA